MRAAVRVLILGVVVSLVGGCGSPAPPGPASVRGKVTFQGQPLPGGLVVFTPDRDRGTAGKPVRGEVAGDGSYQCAAVPPGWYRITLAGPPAATAFPPQLRRPDQSGLVREVTAGRDHVFEFAVEVPTDGPAR